jgi:tRNA dimethylallyltransferase
VATTPKPPLIVLVGPTAVGKTETAIRLAQGLNAEIVSADSRLFYRGMDIGTAKPTALDRARVPHHLVDIANPDETLSLGVFQSLAQKAIAEIHGRGKLPLLVGGTGQYVRAVTEGWQPPPVKPNEALRSQLEDLKRQRGPTWLHEKLAVLDPESAQAIDARNARRTMRAVEVILTTGRKFSDQRGHSGPSYQWVGIGLQRPRTDLYARIDARIDAMFDGGFVEEVKSLLAAGYSPELPSLSAIGYREAVRMIGGDLSLEEAKTHMKRATRAFVRRQSNWFKTTDPNITWFDAADHDLISKLKSFVHAQMSGSGPPALS